MRWAGFIGWLRDKGQKQGTSYIHSCQSLTKCAVKCVSNQFTTHTHTCLHSSACSWFSAGLCRRASVLIHMCACIFGNMLLSVCLRLCVSYVEAIFALSHFKRTLPVEATCFCGQGSGFSEKRVSPSLGGDSKISSQIAYREQINVYWWV